MSTVVMTCMETQSKVVMDTAPSIVVTSNQHSKHASFTRAFDKQNNCMETAIKSLDNLNDQILQCIFSPKALELSDNDLTPKDREKLKGSMALMRKLLTEAQVKFKKMVEDNKRLATRIDSSIYAANQEVSLLKAELADTSHKMMEISQLTRGRSGSDSNLPNNDVAASEKQNLQLQELNKIREENSRLRQDISRLEKELQEAKSAAMKATKVALTSDEGRANNFKLDLIQTKQELNRAHEALQAMKADRKRLKAEKLELLSQMKQLYCTLEDKEAELRDFIRNYEQRMRETDDSIKQLASDKENHDREKWTLLKRVDESSQATQLLQSDVASKDAIIDKLHTDINQLNEKLKSLHTGESTMKSTTSSSSSDSVLKNQPQHLHVTNRALSPAHNTSLNDTADGSTYTDNNSPKCTLRIKSSTSLMSGSSGYHGSYENIPRINVHRDSNNTLNMQQRPQSYNHEITGFSNTHYNHEGEYIIISDVQLKRNKKSSRSKSPGPLSRIFGKSRSRRSVAVMEHGNADDQSDMMSKRLSILSQDNYQEKLGTLEQAKTLPMGKWKANHVLSWMEIDMNMPSYGKMCAENIKSGKVLLGLSDSELDSALDLKSTLHRRKLRLAIEEHRDPSTIKFSKAANIDHSWVSRRWIVDLGLSQYSTAFDTHLVDGRLLNVLTKRDLEKYLGVHRKFHQASILHGVELLRRVQFDKEALNDRRCACDNDDDDPLVWSNQRLIKWVKDIDLDEYVCNLNDSGVHGAVLVLEPTFTTEAFANLLGIPPSKSYVRRHLATEFESLVRPARSAVDPQSSGKKKTPVSLGRESGRAFVRSYKGQPSGSPEETPTRRLSFRGSLSRALGKKVKDNLTDMQSTSDQSVNQQEPACDQQVTELSGTVV